LIQSYQPILKITCCPIGSRHNHIQSNLNSSQTAKELKMTNPKTWELKIKGGLVTLNAPSGYIAVKKTGFFGSTKTYPLADPSYEISNAATQYITPSGFDLVKVTQMELKTRVSIGEHILWESTDLKDSTCISIFREIQKALVVNSGIDRLAAQKDISGLIAALDHQYYSVRETAAKHLMKFGNIKGVEYLFACLTDRRIPSNHSSKTGAFLAVKENLAFVKQALPSIDQELQEGVLKATRDYQSDPLFEVILPTRSQPVAQSLQPPRDNAGDPFTVGDIVEPYRHYDFETDRFLDGVTMAEFDTQWKVLDITPDYVHLELVSGKYKWGFGGEEYKYPGYQTKPRSSDNYRKKHPHSPGNEQILKEYRRVN
jgi:hypothetical protein